MSCFLCFFLIGVIIKCTTVFIDAADIITTIAGSSATGYSGDNGQATSATLSSPYGVALDSSGSCLYFFRLRFDI